jgi:hypothetical protein
MERITSHMINKRIEWINETLKNPVAAYTKGKDGTYKANIGNMHLASSLSRYALEQIVNPGGGVTVILSDNTQRGLFEQLCAFHKGLTFKR